MRNHARLCLLTVTLLALAACSSGESNQPETTSTTAQAATTSSTAPTTTTSTVTTTTAAPSSRLLTIAGFQFSGATAGRVGDTVRVVNNDVVGHTWTANTGTFDSGLIGAGQAFSYTFDQPGTYNFFCVPHPGMVGGITITG